jgi:tetratricopeptide (TPR) repeat protein
MEENLRNLEKYIIYATAFLIPISFLPIFPNFFITTKLLILAIGVSLAILTKIARMIISGNFDVFVSNYDFPVFLLAAAYLISAILRTPNRMEAFFLPGTTSIVIFSVIYYFLVNQIKEKDKEILLIVTLLSGIIVALFSLFGVTGILAKISPLPAYLKDTSFTPLGGNFSAALYLAAMIPLGINFVISQKDMVKKTFFAISLGVITFGLMLNIYNMLPGKPTSPSFISLSNSWAIAIDSLKESPILGVGPGNYLTAFNRFRPLSFNSTPLWNVRFTAARNFYFTAITETGLIGMAALIILIYSVYKFTQKDIKERSLVGWNLMTNSKLLSLITILVILALFSASIELTFLTLLLLAVNAKSHKIELRFSTQTSESQQLTSAFATRLPAILATLPVIVGVIALFVIGAKIVSAELTFKKSLDALARNDGTATYTLMQQAINQNPQVDRYHASLAQINLALADSIARKPEGQELTEEERNTISQLIQQSINEGKAAVALNPLRSGNWELLGSLYRSVMAFAQGADAFAVQAYSQAVALDPVNPIIRINLGGLYFAVADYESAIDVFKLAVLAKPDYANGRYNLAAAYRENGNIDKAISEMTAVLSLVDRNTPDYEVAKQELEALEAKKPVQQAEGTENLIPPQEAEEPVVQPPIELPEGAEPPSTEVTPRPSPTPTIEP